MYKLSHEMRKFFYLFYEAKRKYLIFRRLRKTSNVLIPRLLLRTHMEGKLAAGNDRLALRRPEFGLAYAANHSDSAIYPCMSQ